MKPLHPDESAVLYLHAVDGETVTQIARRQGVTTRSVSGTLKACRTKLGATTNSQAALRAYLTGQLADADRTYPRRRNTAQAEEKQLRKERNKMRSKFARRGLIYDAGASPDPDDPE